MSDLLITVFSLVGGAVFASISGIVVTTCVDCRKEKKQMKAFKLEFKLNLNQLYNKLYEFEELNKSNNHDWLIDYISTSFVSDPIFKNYQKIALIPKINIDLYFEMINELEYIDDIIKPFKISPDKIPWTVGGNTILESHMQNSVWKMIYDFRNNHLQDIKDIMGLLK